MLKKKKKPEYGFGIKVTKNYIFQVYNPKKRNLGTECSAHFNILNITLIHFKSVRCCYELHANIIMHKRVFLHFSVAVPQ